MLTGYAEGFAVFDKINITRHFAGSKAFVELNGLQLPDHTQTAVIKNNSRYWQLVAGNGKQLRACHFKTAVAADADHAALGPGQLSAHGRR